MIANCVDQAKTTPERIFCQLREAIVEGRIKPGSKIGEADLAQAHGISRGPLREAISQLAAIGLIERKPHIGARVIQLGSAQLMEIFHVREALEGMAARQAAFNMSTDAVHRLYEMLNQHADQIERDTDHAYFQQSGDLDFHFQIVQGSANQYLIKLLCRDLYHLVRMYRYQFGMRSKRGPIALVEHQHIADAIARSDGEMAELLMRAHVRASRENAQHLLQAKPG